LAIYRNKQPKLAKNFGWFTEHRHVIIHVKYHMSHVGLSNPAPCGGGAAVVVGCCFLTVVFTADL